MEGTSSLQGRVVIHYKDKTWTEVFGATSEVEEKDGKLLINCVGHKIQLPAEKVAYLEFIPEDEIIIFRNLPDRTVYSLAGAVNVPYITVTSGCPIELEEGLE